MVSSNGHTEGFLEIDMKGVGNRKKKTINSESLRDKQLKGDQGFQFRLTKGKESGGFKYFIYIKSAVLGAEYVHSGATLSLTRGGT